MMKPTTATMTRRTIPSTPFEPVEPANLFQRSTYTPRTLSSELNDRHLAFEKIRVLGWSFCLIRQSSHINGL